MSYLLYTSPEAATGLIPQPGRAVNTFPSGLVRVDQTYLGLTSNAATHRAILAVGNDMPDGDTAPCIDGLKIFPEAQERRREDGFTEYIVSAYGRSNSTGITQSTFEDGFFILRSSTSFNGQITGGDQNRPCVNEIITVQNVVPHADLPTKKIPLGVEIRVWIENAQTGDFTPLAEFYPEGTVEVQSCPECSRNITTTQPTIINATLISNESKSFGYFDEKIMTYRASGLVRQFTQII
jgi:hypothetical protein